MQRCLLAAVALSLAGCARLQPLHGTGATAVRMDVTCSGDAYHGFYVKNYVDGKLVNASGVVLSKNRTHKFAVESMPDGGTVVEIDGDVSRWPGRPLLVIAEPHNRIQVIAADIPLRAFESQEKIETLVKDMLGNGAEPRRP